MNPSEIKTMEQDVPVPHTHEAHPELIDAGLAEAPVESIEAYVETASIHVEQTLGDTIPENDLDVMESELFADLSPDLVAEARAESGIEEELGAIRAEGESVVAETRTEISQIASEEKVESEVPESPDILAMPETREKTPEEIRIERRTEIIRGLEAEWEKTNGPMERRLTTKEIDQAQAWAEFNKKEWDGKTMKLTDRASDFYFDFDNTGQFSVPERAEKILRERYPEYEVKKKEQPKAENVPVPVEYEPEQPVASFEARTDEFIRTLEEAGVSTKRVAFESVGEYPEAIVFEKKEGPPEKTVRIYRGIGDLDISVIDQNPYAMRSENPQGKPMIIESVREDVERLAQEPTYENLSAYLEKVRPSLSSADAQRFDQELERIEKGVLSGFDMRQMLLSLQTGHGGGWAESGISPYVSASYDAREAAGYGQGGLMVMDVPLSEIEEFQGGSSEIGIRGSLDPKYITAIVPRNRSFKGERMRSRDELVRSLQEVKGNTEDSAYEDEELRLARARKFEQEIAFDEAHRAEDVRRIRLKRAERVRERFPEVDYSSELSDKEGLDPYAEALRHVFDFYKTKVEKTGTYVIPVNQFDYSDEYGRRRSFKRDAIDDEMLANLKDLTRRLEERDAMRKAA